MSDYEKLNYSYERTKSGQGQKDGQVTDYEKLKALFDEFGIGYDEMSTGKLGYLRCKEGGEKIEGYVEFYTDFDFDKDGNFLTMGAWE